MADVAIRLDGIGKLYRIGIEHRTYHTLRDVLSNVVRRPFRRLRGESSSREPRTFWALRDVSFEVGRGEVVGIIGRNGAGKSTLLKILSRITEPTSGIGKVHGSMASLLEVGAGFHGELTGRENIYLNGAILGMKKADIERKFDEIVSFSEVERFLDTPVKHYSSGMYVRLAFAVAAHLEPDILVIDEVLAVGDAAFQKKCLGKMENVARGGRTVLYVSHNMDSITHLCSRAILLESGRVSDEGDPNDVVRAYLERSSDGSASSYRAAGPPLRDKGAWISAVEILDDSGAPCGSFVTGEPMRFRVFFEQGRPLPQVEVGLVITDQRGHEIAAPNSRQQHGEIRGVRGRNCFECRWEGPPLTPKRYTVRVDLGDHYRVMDSVDNAVSFEVQSRDYFGTGKAPNPKFAVVSRCSWIVRDERREAAVGSPS